MFFCFFLKSSFDFGSFSLLAQIKGSGPKGLILKGDILQLISTGQLPTTKQPAQQQQQTSSTIATQQQQSQPQQIAQKANELKTTTSTTSSTTVRSVGTGRFRRRDPEILPFTSLDKQIGAEYLTSKLNKNNFHLLYFTHHLTPKIFRTMKPQFYVSKTISLDKVLSLIDVESKRHKSDPTKSKQKKHFSFIFITPHTDLNK